MSYPRVKYPTVHLTSTTQCRKPTSPGSIPPHTVSKLHPTLLIYCWLGLMKLPPETTSRSCRIRGLKCQIAELEISIQLYSNNAGSITDVPRIDTALH